MGKPARQRIAQLDECFYRLARLVSTGDKGLFNKCTFTLLSDGKYDTGFVYWRSANNLTDCRSR